MRIPKTPPSWRDAFTSGGDGSEMEKNFRTVFQPSVQEFVRTANDRYIHWDKLRFRPMPEGITPQLAWTAVQLSRSPLFQRLPFTFGNDSHLRYWVPPQ